MWKLKEELADILYNLLTSKDEFEPATLEELRKKGVLPENRDFLKKALDVVGAELGEKGFNGDDPNKYGQELEDLITALSSAVIDFDRKTK